MDLTNRHDEDWKKEAPNLAAMDVVNPFAVPDNYFEDLKGNLEARVRIDEIVSNNAFVVPEGYFDTLEERINGAISLNKLQEEIPSEGFSVPQGYFENLSEVLKSRIAVEQALEQETSFAVPDGYFAKLQDSILAKTINAEEVKPEAKVRKLTPSWLRYAAAACITAIIGTVVYLNAGTKETSSIEKQLAEIPEQEIVNYLQAYSSPGDGEIIAEHLEKTNNIPGIEGELSDKEIKDYLESTL